MLDVSHQLQPPVLYHSPWCFSSGSSGACLEFLSFLPSSTLELYHWAGWDVWCCQTCSLQSNPPQDPVQGPHPVTTGPCPSIVHWKNGRRGVVQCKSMHFVYATQLICISLQNTIKSLKSISILMNFKRTCLCHFKKKEKSYVLSDGSWKARAGFSRLSFFSKKTPIVKDLQAAPFSPSLWYFLWIWAASDTIKVIKTYQIWARDRRGVFIIRFENV